MTFIQKDLITDGSILDVKNVAINHIMTSKKYCPEFIFPKILLVHSGIETSVYSYLGVNSRDKSILYWQLFKETYYRGNKGDRKRKALKALVESIINFQVFSEPLTENELLNFVDMKGNSLFDLSFKIRDLNSKLK